MIEPTDGQRRRWSNASKLVYPPPTKLIWTGRPKCNRLHNDLGIRSTLVIASRKLWRK